MNESLTLMQALGNFHFLRPLWLLALIPALFFFRRLWILESSSTAWQKVIDQSLLPYLLKASRQASKRLPLYLLLGVWVASIIALAGPTWKQQPAPVQQRQDALVIVLDLSVPMFATDEEPNRLTVARRKVLDLLNQRIEGQTGLVVYAGEAHMVTPLTDDSVSIRAMVPALTPNIMPVRGNNPAQALQMAVDLLNDSSVNNGRILLLSSGIGPDGNQAIMDVMSTAPYPLHVIGVGTESGATIPTANGQVLRNNSGQPVVVQMNRDNLQRIAETAGGLYHDITLDNEDLDYVLDESRMADSADDYQAADDEVALWEDAGPWLILLVLPLAALCFRRGWVMQLALACGATWMAMAVLPGQPLQAQEAPTENSAEQNGEDGDIDLTDPLANPELREQFTPNNLDVGEGMQIQTIGNVPGEEGGATEEDPGFRLRDLFLNREQRAMEALQEQRPAKASQLFEDPEWRGTAHYRAGNYAAAIADFSESDDIESLYNLGNALAFAERLQESVAAYTRVLELNPQHQDAAHNKAIVEDLLEQQEQEQQEQEQQEEEQEQQESAEAQSEENQDENEPQLEQEQQEQEQQQDQDPQDQETPEQEQQDAETDNSQKNQRSQNSEFEEDQESLEQFLRRIEDEPGELLQRKFQFESRRRMMERRAAEQGAR